MTKKAAAKNNHILNIFQYVFWFITFVWFVIGAVYLYDTYQDKKLEFKPLVVMDLYKSSELNYNEKIGLINPNDRVKVLRVIFIKDHFVVQVQLANKQIGWILKNADVNLK